MQDQDQMSKHLPSQAQYNRQSNVGMVIALLIVIFALTVLAGASMAQAAVVICVGALLVLVVHGLVGVITEIKKGAHS